MALTSPPVYHDIPLPPAIEDAVIKEARRRARRRRIAQGLVMTLLLAAGAALIGSRTDPPSAGAEARVGQVDGSGLGVAPEGSHLVMRWGAVHVGWVLAYADGRLLSYQDSGPVWERWLTPAGLALARSNAVNWDQFLHVTQSMFPASAWMDPAPREYRPGAYAACLWAGSNQPADVSALPAEALTLLKNAVPASAGHVVAASYEADTWNCLRVTAAELDVLRQIAVRDGGWDSGDDFVLPPSADGSSVSAAIWPVMPHGQWIAWGG
jgi:hypothetical protein